MTTLTLRKVGGSTMLALSPALLQILGRRAGEQVVIKVERSLNLRLLEEGFPNITFLTS